MSKSMIYEKVVIEGVSNAWKPLDGGWKDGYEDVTLVHLYMNNRPRTRYTLTFPEWDALAPNLLTNDSAIGVKAEVLREEIVDYNSRSCIGVTRLHNKNKEYTPSKPSSPSGQLVLSSDK